MTGLIMTGIASVITEIYLLLSSIRDLKERKIYTFPCQLLSAVWFLLLLASGRMEGKTVAWYLMIQALWNLLLKKFRVWGEGDCDVFLMTGILLPVFTSGDSLPGYLFKELLVLIGSLVFSLVIHIAECRYRKVRWNVRGSAAVVPGFCVSVILLFIHGFLKGIVR